MSQTDFLTTYNGRSLPLAQCPLLPMADFQSQIADAVADGGHLAAFFGVPAGAGTLRVVAVVAHSGQGHLALAAADVHGGAPAAAAATSAA